MKLSFNTKIIVLFSILLIALIAGGIISTFKINKAEVEVEKMVQQQCNILIELGHLVSYSQEITLASNGFYISGDYNFLHSFSKAVSIVIPHIKDFGLLIKDNQIQVKQLDSIEKLIGELIDFSVQRIELRKREIFAIEKQLLVSGKDKKITDEIRDIVDRMEASENNLLKKNQEAYLKDGVVFKQTFYLLIGCIFILLIGAFFTIRHQLSIRKKREQKLMETDESLLISLKETNDYKFALVESSIVAITDSKGIIKYANDNFCNISKYSREELIGQDHRIVNSGFHSKEFMRNIWITISSGRIWKGEIKNKAKDGTIYWVDTTIIPFLDEAQKPTQYIAIRNDITERKNQEEKISSFNHHLEKQIQQRTEELANNLKKLQDSELVREDLITNLSHRNNELMQFNYIVSHNLRSPIAKILGLKYLYEVSTSNDEKSELVKHIFTSAMHLDDLLQDLTMILSSCSSLSTKKENVVIPSILERITNFLEPSIEESKAEIKTHMNQNCREIITIKSYLESILFNLISNSIKYRSASRSLQISISIEKAENSITIRVEDNGQGIDLEKNEKYVFGLYKRFSFEVDGKGLGLFMTKRQVEALGGRILLNSKVNEGTVFTIILPNDK